MQTTTENLASDLKKALSEKLPANSYRLWIDPLQIVNKKDSLVIFTPNSLLRDELVSRYLNTIKEAAEKLGILDKPISVQIKKNDLIEKNTSLTRSVSTPQNASSSPTPNKSNTRGTLEDELNLNFTFDQFVVGPDNQMAQASCLAVAREPAKQFNPLFLYGDTGLGKTHLLQAIYHFIANEHPHLKVIYTNCESFTNEFIEAINNHTLDTFRGLYRQVDVLIVDDIQFLADKRSTQEEFFHTFNDLISSHKQVIVSSDSSPAELQKFEHRLTSRFSSGLVASIEKPLFETRLGIIRHKCELLDLKLDNETQQIIAQMPIDNIREINGVLITLNAHFKFNNESVKGNFIQKLFPQYSSEQATERFIVNYEDVITVVSSHFNLRLQDLQSKKRPQSIAYPRQISMYLLRKLTNYSLEEIGAFFGGRDHSTVQYAQMKIEKKRVENEKLNSLLNHLEESIMSQIS